MLREKTQRRLFRTVFLVGCVLPTLALTAWSIARIHPSYGRFLLGWVGYSVGIDLECDTIRTPRPGEYEIEGLRVAHPETGERLAECNRLRVRHDGALWTFVADRCEIAADVDRLPVLRGGDSGADLSGQVATLAAVDAMGEEVCVWRRVRCRVAGVSDETQQPYAEAWTEPKNDSEPTHITWVRDKKDDRVVLTTGDTPLPLRLAPPGLLPQSIARGTTFSGELTIERQNAETAGHASGELQVTTLSGALASWSNASVRLIDLAWTDGRIDRLQAHLEAREGSLNRLFVWGLYQMLKCHPEEALQRFWSSTSDDTPIPFDQLACDVELDATGLTIYGRCGDVGGERRSGAIAHAVLSKQGEPLLLEPTERQQPPTNLVRAVWPDASPAVPATAEAQDVARRLPIQQSPSSH